MTKPHELLGISANADEETIKAAFRRAAKDCHPDLNSSDPGANLRFRRLTAARDILLKRRGRAAHIRDREFLCLAVGTTGRKRIFIVAGALTSCAAILILFLIFTSPSQVSVPEPVSSFTMASASIEDDEVPDAGSAEVKAIRDLREELGSGRRTDNETIEPPLPVSSTSKFRLIRPYPGRFRDTPAKAASRLSRGLRTLASNLRRSLTQLRSASGDRW